MMTKKMIKKEIEALKEQYNKIYKPDEKESIYQKIQSLKRFGLMLVNERNINNQRQYTDGISIYIIKEFDQFIYKNGKIKIEPSFTAIKQ